MEQAIYNNRKNYFFSESMKFEFCGFSKTLPMHSFGPAYRKHYILHIVLDGGGSYYVKNNSYHLTAGDMFLIRPDESTFYQADKNNPWVYCWLAFSGSEAEAIVEQSAFAKERYTLHSSQINSYVDIIKSCLTLNHETIEEELALNELLYKFFRILLIDTTHSVPSLQEEFSPLVQQTIQYVERHFDEEITVQSVALALNIDRSYLSRSFSKIMHTNLKSWILSVKLNYAAYQLFMTKKSVEEIAQMVGFHSIESFSRAYKSFTGESPLQYRKRLAKKENLGIHDKEISQLLEQQQVEKRAT